MMERLTRLARLLVRRSGPNRERMAEVNADLAKARMENVAAGRRYRVAVEDLVEAMLTEMAEKRK